jgi:hypothetical protein
MEPHANSVRKAVMVKNVPRNVIVIVMKGNVKHYKDAVIYHNLSGIRTRNASGDRHGLLK